MSAVLPENATPFEVALAQGMVPAAAIDSGINALRRVKMVSPRPSMLPFLVYEYGLGELTPYVPNIYDLIDQGVRWQRLRGTLSAVAIGLAWVGYAATIEPAWTGRAWWNSFQLRFDSLPAADAPDLERIEGVTRLSVPKRSQLRRGVHGYDVGAVELDETRLDGAMLDFESGTVVTAAGTVWSFGRTHEFEHTLTQEEGVALGNWLVPPGGESVFADFIAGQYRSEAFPAARQEVISVTRAGEAYALNSAGVYEVFAANEPRITDLGFTIEPEATNLTNEMQGGQWSNATNADVTPHLGGPYLGIFDNPVLVTDTGQNGRGKCSPEISIVEGQTYSASFWYKAASSTEVGLFLSGNGGTSRIAMSHDGSVISSSNNARGGMTLVGATQLQPGIYRSDVRWVPNFTGTDGNGGIGAGLNVGDSIIALGLQITQGDAFFAPINPLGLGTTRAADQVQLHIPGGVHQLTYTLDNDATLVVPDTPGGDFEIPTALPRQRLKAIQTVKTDGGSVPWSSIETPWIDANYLWADTPEAQRRAVLSTWFAGRALYLRLSDVAGNVIGYRRCRAVRPVEAAFEGHYSHGGVDYSPDQAGGILYAEALTQFDDAADVDCASLALMVGGEITGGAKPAQLWLSPAQYSGGEAIAVQAVTIPMRRTVREQIKFLMRFQ
ncbi:phage tail protein [Devosia sp. J2-20]|uniref:phage head spike fiber domain-containing protein n=1 Tax=Devosia sp. J2-20 TaxID=3026161 RepID=UPI00249A964C|nr:phage tail protein [Devosia sp. J2-20]WDQ98189.1 phage tail protein [Devosia sp. J2-20]